VVWRQVDPASTKLGHARGEGEPGAHQVAPLSAHEAFARLKKTGWTTCHSPWLTRSRSTTSSLPTTADLFRKSSDTCNRRKYFRERPMRPYRTATRSSFPTSSSWSRSPSRSRRSGRRCVSSSLCPDPMSP
jgi:hypothetical protein